MLAFNCPALTCMLKQLNRSCPFTCGSSQPCYGPCLANPCHLVW